MRKILLTAIVACAVIAAAAGLYFFPIPHHVNRTMDGYIIYRNGSGRTCSVTIDGTYRDHIFENTKYRDLFDGILYVNGAAMGLAVSIDRICFNGEAGHTSYISSSTDTIGHITYQRTGDRLLNKKCNSVVMSCCYDSLNNTDTADEANRCVVIAPAENSEDAESIIASFKSSGVLEQFDTWDFSQKS